MVGKVIHEEITTGIPGKVIKFERGGKMTEQTTIQEYQDDKARLLSELAHVDEQIDHIYGQRPITTPTIRARTNITDSVKGVRTVESTVEICGELAYFTPTLIAGLVKEYREAVDAIWPPPPLTDKEVLAKNEADASVALDG